MAETKDTISSLPKGQKAALIFLMLEENGAARLFDHMTDEEIKSIGNSLLNMGEIPIADMTEVMSEFYRDLGIESTAQFSGKKMFEKLVDKTLPAERKGRILKVEDIRGGKGSKLNPLENMFNDLSGEQIYALIHTEHPQTIAVIMTLMRPKMSKLTLQQIPSEEQVDCLYRMSMLSKIPEDMVNALADTYRKKLSSGAVSELVSVKKSALDIPGTDVVLRYLKGLDWAKAEEVIAQIEKQNREVAAILRKKIFTIADLKRADNQGVRGLLRNVEMATLSVALKGEAPEIQDVFFSNMSTRAATIMREDMEVMREQKPEDVEAAAGKIIEEAKKLILEGQMTLEPIADD